jgi:hypothetical protein
MADRKLSLSAAVAASLQAIQAPHQHAMGAVEQRHEGVLELVHLPFNALAAADLGGYYSTKVELGIDDFANHA